MQKFHVEISRRGEGLMWDCMQEIHVGLHAGGEGVVADCMQGEGVMWD